MMFAFALQVPVAVRPEPAGHSEHAPQGTFVPPADQVVPAEQAAQTALVVGVQSVVAPWPEAHEVHAEQGA